MCYDQVPAVADLGSLLVIGEKCILISKLNFFKFISCLEVSEIVR